MTEATLDRSRASAQLLELSPALPPGSPDWLNHLRSEAATSFERLGIPNRKEEGWRYTNLDPLVGTNFVSARKGRSGGCRRDLRPTPFHGIGLPETGVCERAN